MSCTFKYGTGFASDSNHFDFYGLALFNVGKFTFRETSILAVGEIILGFSALFCLSSEFGFGASVSDFFIYCTV